MQYAQCTYKRKTLFNFIETASVKDDASNKLVWKTMQVCLFDQKVSV